MGLIRQETILKLKTQIKCECNKHGPDPLWKRKLRINLIFFFQMLNKLSYTSYEAI